MAADEGAKLLREAWITGVRRYYSGEPDYAFVRGWDELPEWEKDSARAVYEQVRAFVELTKGKVAHLSRQQKGQFVALCWIGQIYTRLEDKAGAHLEEWEEMPSWHQQTDTDIFDRITAHVLEGSQTA